MPKPVIWCAIATGIWDCYNFAIERGDRVAAQEALAAYDGHLDSCRQCRV